MKSITKLVFAFSSGVAVLGFPYSITLGELSASEEKLKILEEVACMNLSDYELILDVAPAPSVLIDSPELWAEAKSNMLKDCNNRFWE
ncbi:hypothetical protein A3715_18790 [Oleiphilus sp. HI0009]|nr:hypothetical protein A3715_18790 [Oleiphilus sp. HI0009]